MNWRKNTFKWQASIIHSEWWMCSPPANTINFFYSSLYFLLKHITLSYGGFNTVSKLYGGDPCSALLFPGASLIMQSHNSLHLGACWEAHHAVITKQHNPVILSDVIKKKQNKKQLMCTLSSFSPLVLSTHSQILPRTRAGPQECTRVPADATKWEDGGETEGRKRWWGGAGSGGISPPGLSNYLWGSAVLKDAWGEGFDCQIHWVGRPDWIGHLSPHTPITHDARSRGSLDTDVCASADRWRRRENLRGFSINLSSEICSLRQTFFYYQVLQMSFLIKQAAGNSTRIRYESIFCSRGFIFFSW